MSTNSIRQPGVIVLKHLDTRGLIDLRTIAARRPAPGPAPVLPRAAQEPSVVTPAADRRPSFALPIFALGVVSGVLLVMLNGAAGPERRPAPVEAAGTGVTMLPVISIVGTPRRERP